MKAKVARGVLGAAVISMGGGPVGAVDLPEGPNRELVYLVCEACHTVQNLINTGGMNRSQWDQILSIMEGYGLQVTPDEKTKIVEYLATYLPPGSR